MKPVALNVLLNRDYGIQKIDRGGAHSTNIAGALCAVTIQPNEKPRLWACPPVDGLRPPMSAAVIVSLLEYLQSRTAAGDYTVTWDGAQHQYFALSKGLTDPADLTLCEQAALNHIDIVFHMFCSKGFTPVLQTVMQAIRSTGYQGIESIMAGMQWKRDAQQQAGLIKMAHSHAVVTGTVYNSILETQRLQWVTQTNSKAYWIPEFAATEDGSVRLLTVREALLLPEPDLSWMAKQGSRARADYVSWFRSAAEAVKRSDEFIDSVEFDRNLSSLEDFEDFTQYNPIVDIDLRTVAGRLAATSYLEHLREHNPKEAEELAQRVAWFVDSAKNLTTTN